MTFSACWTSQTSFHRLHDLHGDSPSPKWLPAPQESESIQGFVTTNHGQEERLKGKPNFAVPLVPQDDEDAQKVGWETSAARVG
jgi:hypothetical protein